MADTTDAEAITAINHILDGDWDQYLLRLKVAVERRHCSAGYAEWLRNLQIGDEKEPADG